MNLVLLRLEIVLAGEAEVKPDNPRLSTTSSTDEEVQVDQLVIAQVHHDPILESQHENEADDEDSDDLGTLLRPLWDPSYIVGCQGV